MVYCEEGEFLVKLADLYAKNRTKGSVWLGMKRFAGRLAALRRKNRVKQAEAAKGEEPKCLVRARTNQKKSKISTIINAKDCARFQLALENIMSLHMDGLKRREKKKGESTPRKKKKPVKKDRPPKKDAGKSKEKPAAEKPDTEKEQAEEPAASPPKSKQKKKSK
mmetsp:Transcript_8367/g.21340  ORF Transcript_8367/g.21340 Transcript_8367/m.21340 type:complete len:165 (+) Transcript_8367:93-587(+)